jgi:zinc transporter, ZIP family
MLTVFLLSLGTAFATGLGALPFAFGRSSFTSRTIGTWYALAGGLMVGSSVMLIQEAIYAGQGLQGGVGLVLGYGLVWLVSKYLRHDAKEAALQNMTKVRSLRSVGLFFWVLTLHSASEGIGMGVAFGPSAQLGTMTSVAMALHNIPEGIALCLMLVPRGVSWQRSGLLAIATSLPQPLLAVPAYLLVDHFRMFIGIGMGLAAGAMLAVCVTDILPESYKHGISVQRLLAWVGG